MKRFFIFRLALSWLIVSAAWICNAYDMVPGPPQNKPVLLVNGTIHTVSGNSIPNGQILFEKGKIMSVGDEIEVPDGCEVIDVSGRHVYPGLISSDSSIGHMEINAVNATIDTGELGAFNPNLRAEVAVNPDSEVIPVTRANGILIAHVTPLSRGNGLIAGAGAVMKLDGWTTEDMTLTAPSAIRITWPRDPRTRGFELEPSAMRNPEKAEENYRQQIENLEEAFANARAFWKAKNAEGNDLAVDLRWESLRPVLKKEIPVHIQASTARQIRDAVHWAKREDLRAVLIEANDAWRVADLLKEHGVPVIIGSVNATPSRRWEAYDTRFRNAVKLHEAGVPFAIAYSSRSASERNLPYEAGRAVAFGLPREEALKAITLYPAEILGVADRLGSLEAGKDATLIVTTGDPLDIRSHVESAFIEGRRVDLSSRHTQLYEKYRQRYLQE